MSRLLNTLGLISRPFGAAPGGYRHASLYEAVVVDGKPYGSAVLDEAQLSALFDAIDLAEGGTRFPRRQCFANSQRVLFGARDSELLLRLRYVEGYMLTDYCPIPILHGWLTFDGAVVDLTARLRAADGEPPRRKGRLRDRVIGDIGKREYRGIEIGLPAVMERALRLRSWGSMLDCHELGFPLLRENSPW